MKRIPNFTIIILLLFFNTINAQKGLSMEVSIGPTVGETRELFSLNIQGSISYLWKVAKRIDLGLTTGAAIFTGVGTDEPGLFSEIPDVYIPFALAGRVDLNEKVLFGADIGYATDIAGSGAFYVKPIILYFVRRKLALTASYINFSDSWYNASSINIGINIGF